MSRDERKKLGWYTELKMGPKHILSVKKRIDALMELENARVAGRDSDVVLSDEALNELQVDRQPDELSGDEDEREVPVSS